MGSAVEWAIAVVCYVQYFCQVKQAAQKFPLDFNGSLNIFELLPVSIRLVDPRYFVSSLLSSLFTYFRMYDILVKHKEMVAHHWSDICGVTNANLQYEHDKLMEEVKMVRRVLDLN